MGNTPLYDAYQRFLADPGTPFCTPGHKRNPDLIDEFLALDVPHYLGVENRRVSTRRLATAERLAGELWGADWCGFSVQGSTHGNEAICLSLGKPGDKVIVARTIHKSVFFGLVLSGLVPVWVRPNIDAQTGSPRRSPLTPTPKPSCWWNPATSEASPMSPRTPNWPTPTASRWPSTPPGVPISVSIRTCRRTPSVPAPTSW
jgi:hypothetical protein